MKRLKDETDKKRERVKRENGHMCCQACYCHTCCFVPSLRCQQREHTSALRQADFVVCRSQPPPDLPAGVSSNLSANYYYMRDGRRAVGPNEVVATNSPTGPTLLLADETEAAEGAVTPAVKKPCLPGVQHNYGHAPV
ncbi:NADH dehydrogenase [ubiquinone] 1 alpha subcomplex subunit 7 [Chionoecetes opilio]|uniref:NADH dehydrogenase [ubiquinone] 1 alpha subcomplex subunit 7 n=1 Tax=Chionoecetes opilio TaxID=41210 RepID=A0A8J5CTD2_CHIOP|nr:NADH dehydrogenase [ubiquinone] 1 alpha subcomplex subunit 7 [Chionoecetes opilio]